MGPGARWLARSAWLALLGLLVVQAALGVRAECARAFDTPLQQRLDALGSATDWRYRNALGDNSALALDIRARLRRDTTVVLVHDGSEPSLRSATLLSAALAPLDVRRLPQPSDLGAVPAPSTDDMLLVVLDPRDALAQALVARGWSALEDSSRGQIWGSAPAAPAASAPRHPDNDAAHSPRMDGGRLALLLALTLGSGVLWLIGLGLVPRDEPLAFAGWAWLTGCTWIGLLLFAWLLAGQPLGVLGPPGWTLLVALPPALLAAWRRRRPRGTALDADVATHAPTHSPQPASPASPAALVAPGALARSPVRAPAARWERLLFAGCVAFALALLADRLVLASGSVIVGGDEGSIWAAKARLLWEAGGFNARYAELAARPFTLWHADYPPLNPLLQVFAGELAGRPLDFENRLPLQLVLPALVLLLAGALRRCTRPALAGLLILVFATCRSTTEAMDFAHSDGLVACGLLLLLDALHRFRSTGEARWLALACSGATLLVFSKNEGLMLLLALALACAAGRLVRSPTPARTVRLWRPAQLAWLLPPLAVLLGIAAHNRRFGFSNDLFGGAGDSGFLARLLSQGAGHLGLVLGELGRYALTEERETRLLVAAFAALLLLFPRTLLLPPPGAVRPDRSACSRTVLLATCGFLLVLLATPYDPGWHVRWSLPRVMFQLLPALVVALGAASSVLAAPSHTASAGSSWKSSRGSEVRSRCSGENGAPA